MTMLTLRDATLNDVALIRSLADGVWQATYADILSPEQIDYMFEMMYSHEHLTEQMRDKHHHFIIVMLDGEPCAYISIEPQGDSRYNFQKIYARREVQGRGVGRYMIEQGIEWVRRCEERLQPEPHDITIELFVNRRNKAVDFYRHMGFEIVDTRDHAIGNDFYMNDYIMQRIIQL